MEWLEKQAIAMAPVERKPKFWKRYVDDVLELIKKGQVRNQADHINTTDPAGNIKSLYEEEKDKQISFLDTLLVRQEDGSVKLLVYRKKSHTDQCLNFSFHHPLNHKLAVIRTLLERCYSIVTEEDERKKEEEHVAKLLKRSISVAIPSLDHRQGQTEHRGEIFEGRSKESKEHKRQSQKYGCRATCERTERGICKNSEISRHRHS